MIISDVNLCFYKINLITGFIENYINYDFNFNPLKNVLSDNTFFISTLYD
jgi:hypothetical protein